MAYEVIRASDVPGDEDQVFQIVDSLHQAKRIGRKLIHDGWETYITDSDTPDEWNWVDDTWEKVR